jgi:hypothetical protein
MASDVGIGGAAKADLPPTNTDMATIADSHPIELKRRVMRRTPRS